MHVLILMQIQIQKMRSGIIYIRMGLVAIIVTFALISDLKVYKISNKLIFTGHCISLIINVQRGYVGLMAWCFGVVIPIGILFILFIFRMIGAGDIKLFSVIGGFIGGLLVIRVIIYSFMFGALLSIFKLIKYKNLYYRMHYLANYISQTIETKKIKPYYKTNRDGLECVIPFTLAIGMGFICVIIFDL